jgi:hypothetical protein
MACGCGDGHSTASPGAFVTSARRKSLSFCRHSVWSGKVSGSDDFDSAAIIKRSVSSRSWSNRESPGARQDEWHEWGRVEHDAVANACGVCVRDTSKAVIRPIVC